MKRFTPILLTSTLLGTCSTWALNPVEGFYGGFMFGGSYVPSVDFIVMNPFNDSIAIGNMGYRVSGNAGLQLGYRINKFRVEAEGNYNTNNYSKLTVNGVVINSQHTATGLSLGGRTIVISGFLNGYYDFYSNDSESNIVPYLGLGLGYATLRNSIDFSFDNVLIVSEKSNNSESGYALQLIVGVSYFIDDFTAFGMDYRYISTNAISAFNDQRYNINTLNFNINFAFGS